MVRVIIVLSWRFFTGLHMDGKIRKHGRGSVLPRYSNYYWNRYSRRRRAIIRHCVFWFTCASVYGAIVDWNATKYGLLAIVPFVVTRAVMLGINALTQVTMFTDSDGVTDSYRIIRPKIMTKVRKYRPAKLRISLPDNGPVPVEIQRSILAENAEDGGEPILNMRFAKEMEAGNGTPRNKRGHRRSSRVGGA